VLHEGAWHGYSQCVKILCNVFPKDLDENSNKEKLSWKKNHFLNRSNFAGFSALHLAAQNGHNQTLRELLYAGSSTSIHNDYGDTPLHTSVRYGHAGAVRILISAKSDVDAFNLNHDTPLHIACAMGRRKLTKLLLEADAMQFQNLQHETPLDIAHRKNLKEIVEIMTTYKEKLEKKMLREASKNGKSPNHQTHLLPHNSKSKYNNQSAIWSPYGCHYYPDTRNFPSPKLESLPKEPLDKGEQYYLDLGGNIRKGPVGKGNKCNCAPFDKNASVDKCQNAQKYVEKANQKLDLRINALATRIAKTAKKHHQQSPLREKTRERNLDPLYPLLRIVGDKNKQHHLKQWLTKVYPNIGSSSDLQLSPRSGDVVKEVFVDVHHDSTDKREKSAKLSRNNSRRMPEFDENDKNNMQNQPQPHEHDEENEQDDDDDENYTDISNESDDESGNGSIISNNENCLYDESFLRNFQHQQQVQNATQNDSVTSPSISSNQNIEMEMEKITKSLLLDSEGLMVNRNPDVIKDHIHHSAKRSTKRIKSAIKKSTASSVLTSCDLYVNSFFKTDSKQSKIDDEDDSLEIDELISKVHQTILNSSNVSTVSSSTQHRALPPTEDFSKGDFFQSDQRQTLWNQSGRSRNPLPMDIDEIEKYAENIFAPTESLEEQQQVTTSLNETNFILLDQLMKARKKFNQTYQQQLEMMNEPVNQTPNVDSTVPSSSTLV
jgi:Ankyrin repeats (3 copies)/Ankyrin repeat